MVIQYMANCCCKGKEVRSRSDRDREVKLSWAHTVTLKHTDIDFRVTESVATSTPDQLITNGGLCILLEHRQHLYRGKTGTRRWELMRLHHPDVSK